MNITSETLEPQANREANDDGAIALMATILERFNPRMRRAAALKAASLAEGPPAEFPPIYMALSTKQPPELRRNIAKGSAIYSLSAISEMDNPQATCPGVLKAASSIASGLPIAGDPEGVGSATLGTAITREAMANPGFRDYVRDKGADEIADLVSNYYDCHQHNFVLGGTPMRGDTFLERIRKGLSSASDLIGSFTGATAPTEAAQKTPSSGATAATLSSTVDKLKKEMEGYADKQKEYMATAEAKALEAAKMSWASAILSAPSDVARLLVASQPDFTSPKEAVASAFDLVGTAKSSGDVTGMAALVQGLKAAVSRGKVPVDIVSSLLGDPEDILSEGPTSAAAQIREYLDGNSSDERVQRVLPNETSANIIAQIEANRGVMGNDL